MASEEMPEMVQTGDEFPDGRTGGSGDKRLPPAGAVGSATTPSDGHIWSSNTIEAADSLGKAADKTTARQWVMAGSQKKLDELLRGGGDVQDLDADNISALMVACRIGNMAIIKVLHKYKAPLLWTDVHGRSTLHYAAAAGHVNVIGYLLRHACPCEHADLFHNTPLHEACRNGHAAVVHELHHFKADLSRPEHAGWRPIHLACWYGHLEVVKALESAGVSLEELKADSSKSTPLHVTCMSTKGRRDIAMAQRRAEIVRYLLSRGVDMFAKDAHDRDAAVFASQRVCKNTASYYRKNPETGKLEWYTDPCPVYQTLLDETERRREADKLERRRLRAEERARQAEALRELEKAAELVQKVYRNHKAYLRLKQRRAIAKLPPMKWTKLQPDACVMVSDGVRKWQGYHDNYNPDPRIHATVAACKGTIWVFGGIAMVDDKDEIHNKRRREREIYEAKKNRTRRPSDHEYEAQGLPQEKEAVVLNEMWEWNGGRWCHHNGAAGELPRARAHHSMTQVGHGSMFAIVGGLASTERNEWLTDLHIFDVVTETWSSPNAIGEVPVQIMWHAAVNVPTKHSDRVYVVGNALAEPQAGEHEAPDGPQSFQIELPRHRRLRTGSHESQDRPRAGSYESHGVPFKGSAADPLLHAPSFEYTDATWSRGGAVIGLVPGGGSGTTRPPPLQGLTAHKVRHRLAVYGGGGVHSDFLHVQVAKDLDKKDIAPRKPYNADEANMERLEKESFASLNLTLPSVWGNSPDKKKKKKKPRKKPSTPLRLVPGWFDAILSTCDDTVEPPPSRCHQATLGVGDRIIIFGGKYDKFQHLDDGDDGDWFSDELIVAEEQPLDRNGRPKFSHISGREEQKWTNIEIEGHICRAGHGICIVDRNLYMFGGMSTDTTHHNDLMVLQKVNRSIFAKALSEPPPILYRERNMLAKAMHAVVHDSDNSTTSTEVAWMNMPKAEMTKSANIRVQYPDGPQYMVVTQLPHMTNTVGYDNCFSSAGQSLQEIMSRSTAAYNEDD